MKFKDIFKRGKNNMLIDKKMIDKAISDSTNLEGLLTVVISSVVAVLVSKLVNSKGVKNDSFNHDIQ